MKKFNNLNLLLQAILIYFFTIVVSILLNPIFSKVYLKLYKPSLVGTGLFIDLKTEVFLGGFIVGYVLLLSFLVFVLINKKQWTIWIIGVIIPMIMSLGNGIRYILYTLLLSAIGYLLAQGVLLIKKNKK